LYATYGASDNYELPKGRCDLPGQKTVSRIKLKMQKETKIYDVEGERRNQDGERHGSIKYRTTDLFMTT